MSRKLKLLLFLILFSIIVVVVRQNVTAIKEYPNREGSGIVIEPNSEIVSKILKKLDILEDSVFNDDVYKYLYFNLGDKDKKSLSSDEMLYLSFEKLYKNDEFEKTLIDNETELLKIDSYKVQNVLEQNFKIVDFKLYEVNYEVSTSCGIVGYIYTGDSYELKYRRCDKNKNIHKVKYQETVRIGDIIKLKVKSFYADTNKRNFDRSDKVFSIKNHNENKSLGKVSLESLDNNSDEIFDEYDISEYVFDFEFRDDDYNFLSVSLS